MTYEVVDPNTGLPVLAKQPNESRVYRLDFTNLLVGASLSSITSLVAENQGEIPGSTSVTLAAQVVGSDYIEFRISGGTNNENYKITADVVDSAGNTLEGEGMLYVRDY